MSQHQISKDSKNSASKSLDLGKDLDIAIEDYTCSQDSIFSKIKYDFRMFSKKLQISLMFKLRVLSFDKRIRTFWGQKMHMIGVRPSSLYFSGYIGNDEVFITRYIIENLEQGATFLDVGANIGFFALLASKIVGPSGNVIAFEPAPLNYEYLKRNAENIKNIACYDIALHDMNGKSVLHDFGPYNNFYNSLGDENKLRDALVDIRNTEPSQDVTVFTQTLDSFCTSHNVHPDMIKIDTEETEDIIIEAGLDTIEKYKPDIIFEMLNFSIKEGRLEKLILEITPFGYSCYQFTNEGLCKISSIGDINFKFYNFLLTTTSNSDR